MSAMKRKPTTLPDDIDALKKLVVSLSEDVLSLSKENASLHKKYNKLIEELLLLRQKKFAASSEKSPGQGELFDEAESTQEDADALLEEAQEDVVIVKKSSVKSGRKPLPKDLPREEIIHDIPKDERQCECGDRLHEIGSDISEQLEIIPAQLKVIRHVCKKYACKSCENGVKKADKTPQLLPKSNASASTLAYLITAKYQDGLPLYRLSQIFTRHGIDLSRQTLSDWVVNTAHALSPIAHALQEQLMKSHVIHMDETRVQVLHEKDRKAESQSYMWVQKGGPPGKPIITFHYNPSRSGRIPQTLLAGYGGALMTDGYEGYNTVVQSNKLDHLCCMAHMRRKFIDAQKTQPKPKKGQAKKVTKADLVVNMIKQLYAIEHQQKDNSPEERFIARQEKTVPILNKLKSWLDAHAASVLPNGALGKAIHYALRYWKKLTRFVENGSWPIDNNPAENAIRPFVIGRKNWLFSNTPKGAKASALLYGLIETAKANGHEPYHYLTYLFTELPKHDGCVEGLMPWDIDPVSLV